MNETDSTSKLFALFRTPKYSKILGVLAVVIIALLIFQAGIFIGYRKAAFSFRLGDNYYRAFGRAQERDRMLGDPRTDFLLSNGASGTIIKVSLPTFVLEDSENVERVVRVGDDTIIRLLRESLKPADLKDNQYVVVIGAPNNNSEIEARFIRVLPAAATMSPKLK